MKFHVHRWCTQRLASWEEATVYRGTEFVVEVKAWRLGFSFSFIIWDAQ